ncbi:MAG TPA: amino acid permease, partial [Spirochaetes bacterium]|nr:amino acid permease [Spirochaetota bacterium]
AMLGSAIPSTGGNYKYPSRMVSPGLAFVGIWVYVLATFLGQIPLYSLACARYAGIFFPALNPELFAIALVSFFLVINLLGISLAAQVQGVMVIVLLGALLFFSGSGLRHMEISRFEGFFQQGAGNILLGTALLTFTYFGSNGIIELGGEIKNPGRVIPRALFIAFPVITVVYILVSLTVVGTVPWKEVAGAAEPLVDVCEHMLSRGGVVFFVLGGAILALTTTLNALFIVGTKSLLVIIGDGILPASLGRVNRRFGTAHVLLIAIWIISIGGILTGFSLETFASYSALGGIIIFFPVLLASIRLPKLYPREYEKSGFRLRGFWLYFCPVVGFIIMFFFSLVIIADLKSPFKIGLFFVFILSGIVFYLFRKAYLKKRGVDLGKIRGLEDWTD